MSLSGTGIYSAPANSWNPAVNDTDISATDWNALLADLSTALSTAIYKDGQATTTVRIPFAQGISSTLTTDATSITTGSIITAGGISAQKALWIGGLANIAGALAVTGAITATGGVVGNAATATLATTATNLSGGSVAATTGTFSSTLSVTGTSTLGVTTATSIALGTNPAGIGVIRTPNNSPIYARNQANSGDVATWQVDTANNVFTSTPVIMSGTVSVGSLNDDAGNIIISSTNPTIASGFGTGPSITANNTAAFKVTVGTAPGSVGAITMPAAPNGWTCMAQNLTQGAGTNLRVSAMTTTSLSFQFSLSTSGVNQNFGAGDVLLFQATAF